MQRHVCDKFEGTWSGEIMIQIVENGDGWALAFEHGVIEDAVSISCCPFCGVELTLDGYAGKHLRDGGEAA